MGPLRISGTANRSNVNLLKINNYKKKRWMAGLHEKAHCGGEVDDTGS
jgi:hypothetical protein